jgi:hypothetical protein
MVDDRNPRKGSNPIPPMRIGRTPNPSVNGAAKPVMHPVPKVSALKVSTPKVKVIASEPIKPPSKRSPQPMIDPKPKRRRKIRVMIAADKTIKQRLSFWKRHPTQPMIRPPKNWKVSLLIASLLLGAMALVGGGGWFAALYIFNPDLLPWFNSGKLAAVKNTAQTLKEINAEAAKAGKSAGSPVYVNTYPGFAKGTTALPSPGFDDILIPIFATTTQDKITELRVYRPTKQDGKTVFELKDRIAIEGPDEAEAIAPLTASAELIHGSNRSLPLSDIDFVEGKAAASGVWLQLSGDWERSGSQVMYGRIVRYDPVRAQLRTLLNWTSPAALPPHWKQVIGDAEPELFVDQTVGLEPHYQVYQVKVPLQPNPLQLEPVSLTKPAIATRPYENALLLAQNGLWSPALQRLNQIKQNGKWSMSAQTQLDLVQLHAKATKAQADRTWASPTQQVLASLIDGRWEKALTQLRNAYGNGYDTSNLLAENADHLFQRVEAALVVDPGDRDVLRWGALIVALQESNGDAVAWLAQQQAPGDIQQVLALLNPQLDEVPNVQTVIEDVQPVLKLETPQPVVETNPVPLPGLGNAIAPVDLGTEPIDLGTEPIDLPESEAMESPSPSIEPEEPKQENPSPKR